MHSASATASHSAVPSIEAYWVASIQLMAMVSRMRTSISLFLCCSCLSSLAFFKFFAVVAVGVVLALAVAIGVDVDRFVAAHIPAAGFALTQFLHEWVFQCYVRYVS